MIRVPAYELTIGTQRWTTQALELDVRLYCAPVPDALVARFPRPPPSMRPRATT